MYTKNVAALCVITLTLFTASFFVSNTYAQTPGISITPATQDVDIGQSVTANITVADMASPGLYSYQFTVYYNNTLLNGTDAVLPTGHFLTPSTPGMLFSLGPTVNQTLGTVRFVVSLLGDEQGKVGSGTLATMTFKGLAAGTANLTIQNLILVYSDGNQPTATNSPGAIRVVPEFTLIALMAAFGVMSAAAVKMKKKLK
jgi:hypothetical protein